MEYYKIGTIVYCNSFYTTVYSDGKLIYNSNPFMYELLTNIFVSTYE